MYELFFKIILSCNNLSLLASKRSQYSIQKGFIINIIAVICENYLILNASNVKEITNNTFFRFIIYKIHT